MFVFEKWCTHSRHPPKGLFRKGLRSFLPPHPQAAPPHSPEKSEAAVPSLRKWCFSLGGAFLLGALCLHRPMPADQGFNWLEPGGIRIFLQQGNRQRRVGMGEVWGKLMRGGVLGPEKNNPEMWRFFVRRCFCSPKVVHAQQTLPQCFFRPHACCCRTV